MGCRAFYMRDPVREGEFSMLRSKAEVYLHLVWGTWRREPLVSEEMEQRLYTCITREAESLGCAVYAVNGMPDHVHVVVKLPTTVNIAKLAKQVKGSSSTLARNLLSPTGFFGWQDRYAVFSVSRWDLKKEREYVRNQKAHHQDGSVIHQLEVTEEHVEEEHGKG